MSKKSDKEDLKVVKAVETILKYCNSRLYCQGCVFNDIKNDSCMIKGPSVNWEVEETIKFYEEVNE